MSSQSSSTLPSPAEIENLGVLFVGFVAATILYGLTFFRCTALYSGYSCICDKLYYYLIVIFDVNVDILYATTTFCIQYVLSILLTFISQLFFAHRVFQVTGGSRPVTLAVVFLSSISFVFGLVSSGQMFAQRRLSAFGSPGLEIVAAVSQSSAAIADVIIFVAMCYSLRPARYRDIAVPDGMVETAITLFVSRGLAFTVVQISYFGIFVALPSRPLWIPLHMIAIKCASCPCLSFLSLPAFTVISVYVNSVLGLLNAREVKHGQGLNEEDSLTDRKATTDTRFPGTIRLNVDDTKATQRSVILTTGHIDIESQATELESRKAYQDGSGSEYAQVSTRSTRSQTDNDQDKISLSLVPGQ
ncbi:hypothetical protein PAXINDRAFT_180814 [Paxillus involutus ATCC 200175]|uniref:DUF6534 domain-containing protein n=1 Tax=Paxillus involutus ATCC 200175 TaxID=664439 RepID=A0A0C9TXJ8_PAXIN|nr:hypothetical protein PAXINDRAFT_180814 [Paxillus involutus ATCC 200175]